MGTYRFDGRAIVLATALMVATVAMVGCNSAQAAASSPPSAEAVVAALSGEQSTGTGGNGAGNSAGATRSNSGGSVTIDVTWEKHADPADPLTFSVAMNTHSVNLDGFDLGKLAVLRNNLGQEVKPQQWDAPSGGHHRRGVITFPSRDGSGKPIVAAGAKTVELVIRDVAGVKERVLSWELP